MTKGRINKRLGGGTPYRFWTGVGVTAVSAFVLLSDVAQAQAVDNPVNAPAADDPANALTDIIVTAQKRSERLQDVPMAISAFDGSALSASGIRDAGDLGNVVASLNVTQGGGVAQPFLRGIGNPASAAGNESSNAVYVDGVYYARIVSALFKLSNIDRVEVLKGPQGTLFGRNSVGGLINIITRDPGKDAVFEGSIGYGNYDTLQGSAYASTPLTENAAINISAYGLNQGKGWGKNTVTGNKANFDNTYMLRSKLRWDVGSDTTIKISGDYSHTSNDIGIAGNTYEGRVTGNPPGYPPMAFGPAAFYDHRFTVDNVQRDTTWGIALNIDHDMHFARLVSISAYRNTKGTTLEDADFTPAPYFAAYLPYEVKQKSQELQLVSPVGSSFEWIVGAYYLDLDTAYRNGEFTGTQFGAPGQALLISSGVAVRSYAGFGQATVHLSKSTNLTGGLRYTSDKVSARGSIDFRAAPGVIVNVSPATRREATYSKPIYKVVLDQKLGEDNKVYASYGRGFKAGTFNILPYTGGAPVRPETADSFEIGVKSELFDRRLRLNGAIFYTKEKNLQVEQLDGPNIILVNAAAARIKGVEVEARALVAKALTVTAGATYLDAKYSDFKDAPSYPLNPLPPFGNVLTANSIDASGNRIVRAPRFAGNIGAIYAFTISSLPLSVAANYSYNGGFFWAPDNVLRQRPYGLLSGQLTFAPSASSPFSVTLWGRNIGNRKYYTAEYQVGGQAGDTSSPGAPRTFGFTLNFKPG